MYSKEHAFRGVGVNSEKFYDLLTQYLEGTITDIDRQDLFREIQQEPKRMKTYLELRQLDHDLKKQLSAGAISQKMTHWAARHLRPIH